MDQFNSVVNMICFIIKVGILDMEEACENSFILIPGKDLGKTILINPK